MDPATLIAIASLMALAAALYTSVGHAGASAYLAIMTLFGMSVEAMRPTALVLDIVVAGYVAFRYIRAGRFNPTLFLALSLISIPMAYIGAHIRLPPDVYRPLVGITLCVAAIRFLLSTKEFADRVPKPPPLRTALAAGAGLGLLAGLSGTGGGIFLSPLVLWLNWETPRNTSGIAAGFILVNALAGLAGGFSRLKFLPPQLPVFIIAVAIGGLIGTWLGLSKMPRVWILRSLGAVLMIAGVAIAWPHA
jgi:uncharacterized membrane protein YfcA